MVACEHEDGTWHVDVTDAASRPVNDLVRKQALEIVLKELSSLRQHVWLKELAALRKKS